MPTAERCMRPVRAVAHGVALATSGIRGVALAASSAASPIGSSSRGTGQVESGPLARPAAAVSR